MFRKFVFMCLCVLQITSTVHSISYFDEPDYSESPTQKLFVCDNGRRVNLYSDRCNGVDECGDNSDEANCDTKDDEPSERCIAPDHMCDGTNYCISHRSVCDHRVDCPHEDDEGKHCQQDPCYALQCHRGKCELNGTTPYCSCHEGYELASIDDHRSTCVDIDECNQQICSQGCRNLEGSFDCLCFEGYELVNGTKCLARDISPLLYFSIGREIREYNIRSKTSQTVVYRQHREWDHISSIVRFADRLFFVGTNKRNHTQSELIQVTLFRESIPIDETILDYNHKYGQIRDISVDWVYANLYLATGHNIIVCRIEPFACAPILIGLASVHSILVLPTSKSLFWSQDARGGEAGIFTSNLDGAERNEKLLGNGLFIWPTDLAFEDSMGQLYWIDKMDSSVYSYELIPTFKGYRASMFHNTQRQHVLNQTDHSPTSIDVFEDLLYWVSAHNNSIFVSNKRNGSNTQVLIHGSKNKFGYNLGTISVYHPLNHPNLTDFGSKPCLTNPCSHICLPSKQNSHGYVCVCPENMYIIDINTCGHKHNSSSLIVSAGYQVMRLFADSEVPHNLLTEQHLLIDEIAFNFEREELYFHDRYHNQIGVFHIRGSEHDQTKFSQLVVSRLREVVAMMYDVNTDYLYWVDQKKGTFEVTTTKGQKHRAILCSSLEGPLSLALNAREKKWYIGLDGRLSGKSQIISLSMDGTDRKLIVESSGGIPMELTINTMTSELFWGDPASRQIQYMFTSNLSNPQVLDDNRVDTINSLTLVDKTNLCWTNAESLNIYCRQYDNTHSDNSMTIPTLSMLFIRDVPDVSRTRVTSGDRQTVLHDVCLTNPCEHFCLISSCKVGHGYSCACSDGFKLGKDMHSCERNVAWKGNESKEENEQMESFGKGKLIERISQIKQNSNATWQVVNINEIKTRTWSSIWLQVAVQVLIITSVVVIVFGIYKVAKRYRKTIARYLNRSEDHDVTTPIAEDQSNGTENAESDFMVSFRRSEIDQNNNNNDISVPVC